VTVVRDKILLPVTINGRSMVAIFDSGAARSAMSLQAAETLGLSRSGGTTVDGFGGSIRIGFVRDVAVGIGDRTQEFRRMPAIDFAPLVATLGRNFDLILGADALPGMVIAFDPTASTMTFTERDQFVAPPGAQQLTLRRRGGLYEVSLEINGQPARANFDLGAGDVIVRKVLGGALSLWAHEGQLLK
jgi:predicted aspartyl protease